MTVLTSAAEADASDIAWSVLPSSSLESRATTEAVENDTLGLAVAGLGDVAVVVAAVAGPVDVAVVVAAVAGPVDVVSGHTMADASDIVTSISPSSSLRPLVDIVRLPVAGPAEKAVSGPEKSAAVVVAAVAGPGKSVVVAAVAGPGKSAAKPAAVVAAVVAADVSSIASSV